MFYKPKNFPLAQALESNWETIRDEYLALPNESFDPWVQQSMHGKGWSVFGLVAGGFQIPGGTKLCPMSSEIILDIGGGKVGLAGFSRMAPGTHILPHSGWATNEYRLHLGLVVPVGCRLRVGEETRSWQAGKCLIFDDTIEHEAWNESDQVRGNLMLDFLRPGMTEFSIAGVSDEAKAYAERLLDSDNAE